MVITLSIGAYFRQDAMDMAMVIAFPIKLIISLAEITGEAKSAMRWAG
jgi:hypothetical protein